MSKEKSKGSFFILLSILVFLGWLSQRPKPALEPEALGESEEIVKEKVSKQKRDTTKSKKKDWDGTYEKVDCPSAEECLNRAIYLSQDNKLRDAINHRVEACRLGSLGGCGLVAMSAPTNSKLASDWYKKGCDSDKSRTNCFSAINSDISRKEVNSALDTYRSICQTDLDGWCEMNMAPANKTDDTYRKKILDIACSEGISAACKSIEKYWK